MAPILKIDGYDLSAYLRVNPDDQLDLADPKFQEPQFGGAVGSEGDRLINVSVSNKELVLPLHVTPLKDAGFADTIDGLHAMVSDLERRLRAARQLEWRMEGATNSTFFDLEAAQWEPAFDYRRQAKLWCSGTLRVWARPYGHTGTSWLSASAAASGVALTLSPTTLIGDSPAVVTAQVRGPSSPLGRGRLTGYAVVPSGRVVDIPAGSIVLSAGATLAGRSNAAGSQAVYALTIGLDAGAPVEIGRVSLPASQYAGRHRLVALAAGRGITLYGDIDNGQSIAGAVVDSPRGMGYAAVDLGVIGIDPAQGATRTLTLRSVGSVNSGAFREYGSYIPEINRVLLLPEDTTGLTFETYRPVTAQDSYFQKDTTDLALNGTDDDLSNTYVVQGSLNRVSGYAVPSGGANATGLAFVGGLATHPDLDVEIEAAAGPLNPPASSLLMVGKRIGSAMFIAQVRNNSTVNSQQLHLVYAPNRTTTPSLLASVAAVTMSSHFRLRLSTRDTQITANVIQEGTGGATVVASAGVTVAGVATVGEPMFGAYATSFPLQVAAIEAFDAHQGATGPAPRDTISMESNGGPISRSALTGPLFTDLAREARGNPPGLNPATVAHQVVAFQLPTFEQPTNGILDASISVKERFGFAR